MSIEEKNKLFVLHFYELLNQKKFDECNELMTPDFVSHRSTGDVSREETISSNELLFTSFPDFNVTIEHLVAEGDMIAFQEICRGTHQKEFMGIPPTGKKVETINADIWRIADGKHAEAWPIFDQLSMMQQLGAIPSQ